MRQGLASIGSSLDANFDRMSERDNCWQRKMFLLELGHGGHVLNGTCIKAAGCSNCVSERVELM